MKTSSHAALAARAFASGLPPTVDELPAAAFDPKTFERLLTVVCDTSHECGDWSRQTSTDPYEARWEAASRAQDALRGYVQASVEAQAAPKLPNVDGVRAQLLTAYSAASTQAECIVLERAISQIAEIENMLKRLALPMT